MNSLKREIFMNAKKYELNTFIGGVGNGSVTSVLDFIAKTEDLNPSNIKWFEIDDYGNVSFSVNKKYKLSVGAFKDDNKITYFFDVEGKIGNVGKGVFRNSENRNILKMIYIPKATTDNNNQSNVASYNFTASDIVLNILGNKTSNLDFYHFGENLEAGGKVFSNIINATSNNGSPPVSLTTYSYVHPVFIQNYIKPSVVVDLSVSDITSNSVKLNFTPPSSSNAIYKYEVWEGKRFLRFINGSGIIVGGLSTGTYNEIKIVCVDEYYNRSDWSNTVTFTTL